MSTITWKEKCQLRDGKTVRPGDMVALQEKPGHGREFMEEFLAGPGPYRVKRIGQWPCGRHSLYLDIPGREPGSPATDFVLFESTPEPKEKCPFCKAELGFMSFCTNCRLKMS